MSLLLLQLLTTASPAQDALSLEAVRKAQDGLGSPSVTFTPAVRGDLEVTLSCAGRSFRLATSIEPRRAETLTLADLPLGSHRCTGSVVLRATDGTAGEMPLSIEVEVLPPLSLSVADEDLDLVDHKMLLRADRRLHSAQVEVLDEHGALIGTGETTGDGAMEVELPWFPSSDAEPIKLVVTAEDVDYLPALLELSPWSYQIPHEDVNFASGSFEITEAEAPKLERAWADLQGVLARYGDVVEVRLYVVGYTDRVGSVESNQALSASRARAIAAWFRGRGFRGPIHHQGFGETVLAVPTPDETPELRNRRALYLLAASPPPASPDIPLANWTRLP